MKRLNEEKGSITVYVLVTMLLMISVLTIVYFQASQKNNAQLKELEKIQQEYQTSIEDLDDNYSEIIDKNDMEIYIVLTTPDGKQYDINQWTNQDLKLKIFYPKGVSDDEKYYYKNGERLKYTENEIIEDNCTIRVEYEDKEKEVQITKIDKILPTVTLNPNGGNGTITEGQTKATVSTKIEAVDNESGLNELKYEWSQSNTEEPSNWTTFINGETITKADCNAGKYYLWTKVTDMVGNRTETVKVSKEFNVTSSISGGTTKYVKKGGSITLTPTKGGQAGKVTWTTSNSSGAQLSSTTGNSITVKGLVAGTYTVTATESVGGKSTSYTIQVTEIKSGGNATVLEGNTVTLKEPIKSSNAGTITYKVTSGGSYATVNSTTGVVTGKEALAEKTTATITATESNGGATCTYTVTIKVWNGNGLLSDPYIISNSRDLQKLSQKVNKATNTSSTTTGTAYRYASKYFKQSASITLSGQWTPIGTGEVAYFAGTYEGNNQTISGLSINSSATNVGLFGYNQGTIKNLGIKSASIKGLRQLGTLVGTNKGSILNCYVNASTVACSTTYYEGRGVGGIIGKNYGTIQNSYITGGKVTSNSGFLASVGGIVGCGEKGSKIISCSNRGTPISGSNKEDAAAGGIIGTNKGTIQNSYNTASISNYGNTGGIAGISRDGGVISSCYTTGNVSIPGNISSNSNGFPVGGIVGWNENGAALTISYNRGTVTANTTTGSGVMAAGIVGFNSGSSTVSKCYSTGKVSGKSGNIQGVAVNSYSAKATYCYILSGNASSIIQNTDNATSSNVAFKSATDLKKLYGTLGMKNGGSKNSGYPILSWQ